MWKWYYFRTSKKSLLIRIPSDIAKSMPEGEYCVIVLPKNGCGG